MTIQLFGRNCKCLSACRTPTIVYPQRNATDCPLPDGFREETTEQLVAAFFMVWVKTAEVLALKSVFTPFLKVRVASDIPLVADVTFSSEGH
jgi:hypothetical protein